MLRADGVSHAYGDRVVLTDISLVVSRGQRLGLLGENGAGKSTLLRLLAGVEEPDAGVVERPDGTALLTQEVELPPERTVGELVECALGPVRAIEGELLDAAAALGGGDASEAARYAAALEAAEAADIWTIESRRDELLDGLGVGGLALDRPIGEISGGQRSRVALAALLLARPEVLLLDEPTNHLDDAAVTFLVSRLREWRGAVVFASHDRAFLDDVATGLLDIDPSRAGATRFGGNYSEYLVEKARERARWEAQFAAEEREVGALEHAVAVTARQLAPGRGPRDNDKFLYDFKAGNIDRQVRRRVRNAQGRLDELLDARVGEPAPVLSFAGIPRGSHVLDDDEPLLTVDGARVGDRLAPMSLELAPDARLLVTGPNGAGKSTLLGLLAGRLSPDSGRVSRRKGLRVALLEQDVRWADAAATPRVLYERALGERRAEAFPLSHLGLLAERDLDRPVGRLSIGQQRRTALALIIAKPPHVFLLDEPTNHLSLALATELEEALGTYPGAVVVASHDRWLRRRWSQPTLRLAGGIAA
ncbi:MAG TPA: ABC-F family ATP-binding cassette domain-containing protein [Pseudolysinimonas sp.]|nr:ABC-F family ATP-binding cassette domain-containing protein [Pseudolysinimonas sp.]